MRTGFVKGAVQSVEATYLVHQTEDGGRIRRYVEEALGSDGEREELEMEGHFGNRIISVKTHYVGDAAAAAFDWISSRIARPDREQLIAGLASHLDEHSALFLRLDKQKLVEGRLVLGGRETVRVKVKLRLHSLKAGATEFFREELRR